MDIFRKRELKSPHSQKK